MSRDPNSKKIRVGHDIIPKILCFIGALVLWMYVTQVETSDYEETFSGVTVELVNTGSLEAQSGLHIYNGHGNTVNVTVSGRKSDINRYSSESIYVFADVSKITEPGRHTIPINAEVPSGLTVSKLSVSSVNVYVDVTSSIEVDVKPKITTAIIGDGYTLGEISPEYPTITVTGPQTVLNDIDYAEIDLKLGELNTAVTTIAPLELIAKNGENIDTRYVRMSRTEVKVTVPVYTTKEVPFALDYKHGLYNRDNVKITFEPSSITLKGDPKDLEKINSLVLGTIDEKSISSDVTQMYTLNLPNGITSDDNIETVNAKITHIGTTTRSYTVGAISVQGVDKSEYTLLTDYITVKVRGTREEIDKIRASDIKLTVDISDYGDAVSGTITVNASVDLGKNSGNAYAVGDYLVQIKINRK